MSQRIKQKLRKFRLSSPSRPDGPTNLSGTSQTRTVSEVSTPSSRISAGPKAAAQSPKGSPASVASSTIWSRAFQEVEQSEIWSKYCTIVGRNQLWNSADPDQGNQQISAQQISEISLIVTKLQEDKKITQNQSLRSFVDKSVAFVIAIKDAGSAIAALNPYASLGWSVLQFLLSAATASHAVRKECYETLPRVLDWTTRYQMFEQV